MAESVRVLLSHNTNPWFNLATEDWIFRELDPKTHVLFLWRNADTVVIGRHQNPWVECNIQKMETDGVLLARRQSGGGAVFHDLGNTNFTFLSGSETYNQETNFAIIIDALATFGITAERSGRNDILVDGKKVSGSAFKHTRDRSFHHGTLLIHADLTRLSGYLNPTEKKLVSKGIKSVRSRVANLTQFSDGLNHEIVCDAIQNAFFSHWGNRCVPEILDQETLDTIPSLNAYFETMADWEWRFGKTPDFTHHFDTRFAWGSFDVHLDVRNGIIEKAQVFSDALFPELIDTVQLMLPGSRYDKTGVEEAVSKVEKSQPERAEEIAELRDWLITAI